MSSYLDRLDWDKLKSFYVVAVNQSFTKASLQMNITQSALSRQIGIIEQQLNSQLFIRGSDKLSLTPKGKILFDSVSCMIEQTKIAKTLINEEDQQPKGKLVIATTHSFANMWLIEHIPDFLTAYPAIHLSLLIQDNLENLYNRDFDILIGLSAFPNPSYIHEKLMSSTLGLYASSEYIEKSGTPKTIHDLDHHSLISFGDRLDHPYNMVDWFLRIGCKLGEIRQPLLEVNSFYAMIKLVERGMGIITLSNNNPRIKKSGFIRMLPNIDGPRVDTYCNFSKSLENSKRVRVFINFLREIFANESQQEA